MSKITTKSLTITTPEKSTLPEGDSDPKHLDTATTNASRHESTYESENGTTGQEDYKKHLDWIPQDQGLTTEEANSTAFGNAVKQTEWAQNIADRINDFKQKTGNIEKSIIPADPTTADLKMSTHQADIKLAEAVNKGSATDIRIALDNNKKAYESEYGNKDPEGYLRHIDWVSQDQTLNNNSSNAKGWHLARRGVDYMFTLERLGTPNSSDVAAVTKIKRLAFNRRNEEVAYDVYMNNTRASASDLAQGVQSTNNSKNNPTPSISDSVKQVGNLAGLVDRLKK